MYVKLNFRIPAYEYGEDMIYMSTSDRDEHLVLYTADFDISNAAGGYVRTLRLCMLN